MYENLLFKSPRYFFCRRECLVVRDLTVSESVTQEGKYEPARTTISELTKIVYTIERDISHHTN